MKGKQSSMTHYAQRTKALQDAQRTAMLQKQRQTVKVTRTPAKKLFPDESEADFNLQQYYERDRHCDSAVHKQGARRSEAELQANNFKRYLKTRQTATERVSKVQSKKTQQS